MRNDIFGNNFKKVFSIGLTAVLIIGGFFVFSGTALAATKTASVSGDWSNTATWGGAAVPTSADAVTINSGITVTVDIAAAACASIKFVLPAVNNGITISGTNALTVSGAITTTLPTTNDRNSTIAVGAGSLSADSIALAGAGTASRATNLTISTGTVTVSGNITFGGTASQIVFSDIGTLSIGGSLGTGGTLTTVAGSTVNFNGTGAQTIPAYNYNNLTSSSSGARTLASSGTIGIAGTFTPGSNSYTITGSTINFNGSGAQTIPAFTYNNLNTSTGGTKTLGGAITVNGDLTISAGTLDTSGVSNFGVTLKGNFSNSGTFNANGSAITIGGTGTQSIAGFTTIGSITVSKTGGTATLTGNVGAASLAFTSANNTTLALNSGVTLTLTGALSMPRPASAAITLDIGTGTLSCTTITLLGISGGTRRTDITISTGTVTASGDITSAGVDSRIIFSGAGTLNAGGTFMSGTAGTFTASTGTVNCNGSGAQSIGAYTYNNLTIDNTANTVTMVGATTVNGALTINASGTLATGNYGLTLGGNFVNNGTFTAGSSNITIGAGTTTQSIAGFTTTGLTQMTKTAGTATFTGNVNGGALTINGSGGTLNLGSGLTHTFTGTWTRTNGTLNGGSSTLNLGGTVSGTGGTFTASTSTVNYNATGAQTVAGVTYNNLTLSGSGTKTTTGATVNGILSMEGTATASAAPTYGAAATLQYNTATGRTASVEWKTPFAASGGVIIANTGTITLNAAKVFNANVPLTINSGATLAMSTYLLTLNGNLTNNGGTTSGSGGVTITGTATQSIGAFTTTGTVSMTKTGGTATFTGNVDGGALTIGAGGTLNLGAGLTHTFTGTFTRTNGTLNLSSSTLRINGTTSGAGGTWTPGTSTVDYGGTAQTVFAVTYNNLTLSGSGVKTLTSVSTINGNLTLSGIASATLATTMTVGGNLTIGNGTTLAAGSNGLNIGGDWSNNGTFTYGTSTVTLNGSSGQQMTGATTFYNLTFNNSNGLNINNDETINHILTLTSGNITTGNNKVIISAGGTVTHTSGHVVGNLQKNVATGATSQTFEVGTASNYNPVTVAFGSVTTAENLTAKATAGDHGLLGSSTIDPNKSVNVYWTLTNSGITFDDYSATFTFVSDDVDGGADTSNFIVGKYSGGWTYPTVGTKTSTTTQTTGLTSFSDFAIGEVVPPATITIVKDTVPDDPQDFSFTTTGDGLNDFALDDDEDETLSNTRTFTGLLLGQYTIAEAETAGFALTDIQCTSDGAVDLETRTATINLNAGQSVICTFTNTKYGSISGVKWHDLNADGAKDEGELGLESWTIQLSNGEEGTSTETDEDGFYFFSDLLPGTYQVCEELQTNWFQSLPVDGFDCDGLKGYEINLGAGDIILDNDFGNWQETGIIFGYKFNDLDRDGFWNRDEEPGIEDWWICLWGDGEMSPEDECQQTDVEGMVQWEVSPDSEWEMWEEMEDGWEQTAPADGYYEIEVDADGNVVYWTYDEDEWIEVEVADFGNFREDEPTTGTITIVKEIINDDGGTASKDDFNVYINDEPSIWGLLYELEAGTYTISENTLPGYTASVWGGDCAADGTITIKAGEDYTCTITNDDIAPLLTVTKIVINDNGGGAKVEDFTLLVGSTDMDSGVQNSFFAEEYIVSELGRSNGYTATFSGDCDENGGITLEIGGVYECIITNDDIAPKLTVTKVVNNNDGGTLGVQDLPLFVNGDPVNSGEQITFDAGNYTISETQQPGYIGTIGGHCASDGSIILNPGDVKECIITNNDITPGLTVIKTVTNDNGGTPTVEYFTLYIDDTPVTSGQSNVLSAGSYVVNEDPVPGYATTIGGDCDADGNVTLDVGETKVCAITNDDIPPSLMLVKEVINDNGGTAVATDWTLTATGPSTIYGKGSSESGSDFQAGTYTLSEATTDPGSNVTDGYTAGNWFCTNGVTVNENNQITLGIGQSTTCTITNDDIQPKLTVTKVVNNNYGGTLGVEDFPLFIGETPVTSGVQNGFDVGTYTVSETQQAGYAATISGDCAIDGTITLLPGDDKTCTITNNDIPGEIHGMKFNDLNGNGVKDQGESGLVGWTINLSGFSSASTVTKGNGNYAFIELSVGAYTVTETPQAGWMQTTPNPAPIQITLASVVNNVDFGNVRYYEKLDAKFVPLNGDLASTPSLLVLENSSINVSVEGGTSTVSLPKETIITREDGSNLDGQLLTAETVTPGSLTGLGTGVVAGGALKWGLENLGLQFSQPITVSIFVGTALNGQTLNVLRSVSGTDGWTNDGIVPPATCVVTDGLCTFQATKASYYAATYILPPSTSTPAGGGSVLLSGLTIPPESVRISEIGENSVTITWTTSQFSTSQIIYSRSDQPYALDLDAPNYGYAYSKEEDDSGLEKATSHSVTITGLTPGTTYYYRTVSHGSLTISQEYSFTTQGVKIEELILPEEETVPPEEEIVPPEEEIVPPEEEILLPEEVVLTPTEGTIEEPEEFIPEGAVPPEEGIVAVPPEERVPEGDLASLFLASLGEIRETVWMAILVVFCLIGLVIIGIRERELARKKKKSKF